MQVDAIKEKFEIQPNLTLFLETKYLTKYTENKASQTRYARDIFENSIKTHEKLIALFNNNLAVFSVYLTSVINLTCGIKPRSYYSDCT